MCGRDTFFATWEEVRRFSLPLPVLTPAEDAPPAYNRAPTQTGWTMVAHEPGAAVLAMRWGLLPVWAKDDKLAYSTFNARIETAAEKPTFRQAWRQRRCLVPSSGYYEWVGPDKARQPWRVHAADGPLLFFAGLWEPARSADALPTYSILTQPAASAIASLHDRMPVMLAAPVFADWLHGSAEQAMAIVQASEPPALAFHRVATTVGNARNQGPQLIEAID